jgi:predicted nucleic acid-binding Zn ribbon protein
MKLILKPCPDCGTEISRKAAVCPKCGRVLKTPQTIQGIAAALIIGAILFWLLVYVVPQLFVHVPLPDSEGVYH